MPKTLKQMLGWKAMTGVIQDPKGGIPADVLPPEFHRVTRRVKGDMVKWNIVKGNRSLARRVNRGDPSVRATSKTVGERSATLNHTREHIYHEAEILEALTDIGNDAAQRWGQGEVDRKTAEFRERFNNLRVAMVYSALANQHIWFDSDGNMLPSSSGAALDIDFEVPVGGAGVGCTGYIEHNAANRIIDGAADQKWSVAGTDIPGQVQVLTDEKAPEFTGYPIKYAFYGSNIIGYLLANTAIQHLLPVGSQALADLMNNVIPDGFLGIQKWIPVRKAFFEDQDGTVQRIFSADKVCFTPAPESSWWEVIEGTYPIPKNLGDVAADASAALGKVNHAPGMFSYAHLTDDPTGIKHVAGDTCLCVQKVTKAVFNATVHW